MKRRGSYLGGSTVVLPGSDWYSNEADPTLDEYKPTFEEILEDFIREEIAPDLDAETIDMRSPDANQDDTGLIGYNSNKHKPKPYVPAEEGEKFAKKRANSPFKGPRRRPVIEKKSKID